MSRIGRMPIAVPSGAKVEIKDKTVNAEGPKGKLVFELTDGISAGVEDGTLTVSREKDEPKARALHGMTRAILNNMLIGVTQGFTRRLEIQGVGFKAEKEGERIRLALGYSHPCLYAIPDQINVEITEGGTKVAVHGPDKQVVGKVASEMRAFYPAEPYKGKGVRYDDEVVIRKEGKKV